MPSPALLPVSLAKARAGVTGAVVSRTKVKLAAAEAFSAVSIWRTCTRLLPSWAAGAVALQVTPPSALYSIRAPVSTPVTRMSALLVSRSPVTPLSLARPTFGATGAAASMLIRNPVLAVLPAISVAVAVRL